MIRATTDGRAHAPLIGLLVLGAVVIAWMGGGVSLIGDQWAWVFAGLDPHFTGLFENYNGHLMATTFAFYDLLPRISLTQLWIYRAVAIVLHLAVTYLVYLLARPRLGPSLALLPTLIVLILGTGADAYVGGQNYNELASTGACLGALLMLERRTPRCDIAASGLLLLGVASFSNAVAFAAGVAVEILVRRNRRVDQLWIPALPLALYAAWRLHWGSSSDVAPGGPFEVIKQSYRAATGAFAGLAGVQLENFTLKAHLPWLAAVAQVALGVAIVGVCALLVRHGVGVSARLANLAVAGVVLWLLLGLGRGSSQDVYASRYVYEGAVIALLVLVELAAAYGIPGRAWRPALAVAIAITVALNIGWMAVWARHLRHVSDVTRAQLGALEIVGHAAPPDFRPEPGFPLRHVTARDYFRARREFGRSPAYSTERLRRSSEESREAADSVLIRGFSIRVTEAASPATSRPSAQVERVISGRLTRRGRCLTITPRGQSAAVVELASRSDSGITLRPTAGGTQTVEVRRFADRFQPVGAGKADLAVARLLTPLGRSRDPWHVRVTITTPTEIC
jgi:hypothetical protein